MTIITKPSSEKKQDKPVEKPLLVNNNKGTDSFAHTIIQPPVNDNIKEWLSTTSRRRISTSTTICLFVTAFLVISIAIIAGVYLYRQFTHSQMSRFHGFCDIPYQQDALFEENREAEWIPSSLFKEEFDLDLDNDFYAEIYVPDFRRGRRGRFIHDFKANTTGIVDMTSGRCFVMPLDREHVLPPHSLYDLITKMWMGYYNVDTGVVRKTMKVVYPPVDNLDSMGVYIANKCARYPTFRLEQVYDLELKKRSIDAQDRDEVPFIEFAGKNLLEMVILDQED